MTDFLIEITLKCIIHARVEVEYIIYMYMYIFKNTSIGWNFDAKLNFTVNSL